MRHRKTPIRTALALTAAIVAAFGGFTTDTVSGNPKPNARPLHTTHYLLSITVWSDGTTDAAAPIELNANNTARLAAKLYTEEETANETPETNDTNTTTPTATQGTADTQCTATAKSTGKRCRKTAAAGSDRCSLHYNTGN